MDNRAVLAQCQVQTTASMAEALRAIDTAAFEIALIVDAQQRVVGTLTDGDIRRALLAGADLASPIEPFYRRDFTSVGAGVGRAEVLDLMQARWISQIPVLTADGKLIGLHLLRELRGGVERPNWAVILAGGRGTRLSPLTDSVPKPMLRIAGRPILERLVLHLVGFGVRRVYLAVSYLADVIEDYFGSGDRFGCQIIYLKESSPLGTGGALSLLPEAPLAPLLVLNGDLVTQADVAALLEFHDQGTYALTVGVKDYSHTVPFGCVDLDGDKVVGIREKPSVVLPINAGIYVIDPELLRLVPDYETFPMTTLVERAINLGYRVGAFRIGDDWIDVGRADQLTAARDGVPSA